MVQLSTINAYVLDNAGQTHCDWRLVLSGCEEEHAMTLAYIVNAGFCIVTGLAMSALLIYRLFIKGQKLFDYHRSSPEDGIIRPRPIDSMMTFVLMFHIIRMVHSVLLITDMLPNNLVAEFLFDIPWQIGYIGICFYVIGIINTTPNTYKLNKVWLPKSGVVDTCGFIVIFGPVVTNNICTIAGGYFTDQGNADIGLLFIRLHYIFWALWCWALVSMLIFFGLKLVRILSHHINERKDQLKSENSLGGSGLKMGLSKLIVTIIELAIILGFFALVLLVYGIARQQILTNIYVSIVIGWAWTLIVPPLFLIVTIITAIKPVDKRQESSIHSRSHVLTQNAKENIPLQQTSQYEVSLTIPSAPISVKHNNINLSNHSQENLVDSTWNEDPPRYV